MKRLTWALVIAVAVSLPALGDTFSTTGATGDCAGGQTAGITGNAGTAVNAMADISFSGSTITVVLTNCLQDPKSVSQAISDVFFTISGASGGAMGTQTGSLINIASDGTVTSVNGTIVWGLDSTGPDYHLNDLGFDGPDKLIIGPGPYSHCDGIDSICGNDPHNPFIDQVGTFTITGVTGLSEGSTISNVTISFGTTPSTIPEPTTMVLFGTGLLGVAGAIRRRLPKR